MRDPATCATLDQFQMVHVDLELDIQMDLKRVSDVCHLIIHSVYVALPEKEDKSAAHWSVKPFTSFGDMLEVDLPEELALARAFRVMVHYDTDPKSPAICWLEKEQTMDKKLPFMYTQGQEVLNRSLFPCQDSPSIRITYSAAVIVPKELVCVMGARLCSVEDYKVGDTDEESNAIAQKRKFRFEMKQSIPTYLVAMAVGNLVEAKLSRRSSIWAEPCMLEAATREFDGVLEEYLAIGEQLFGDYQWERYDMLVMPPSFPYGGMENPRLTFVSPCVIAGDKSLVSIVAHELSHSWFGNLVTNATWSDFFLNEGFTMYAERRIIEVSRGRPLSCLHAKLGEAQLREEIYSLGELSPLTRLRVPIDEGIDPGDCYNQCAYEKGYAFVCYLRSLVGSDAVFDNFLKRYCAEYCFQSIPAETMINFFLANFPEFANAAGTDLKSGISFDTWLNEPGHPRFTPDFSDAQVIMQNCEVLASHWRSAAYPVQSTILYLSEEAKQWEAHALLYFLDCCQEAEFLNAGAVCSLGDHLSLWDSNNSEILYRWSLILIKNNITSKLPVVRRFLEMQGKQKFHLPVYRSLTSSPKNEMRKFASETFAFTKNKLHVMVRNRIELLLTAAPV